ncbi:MAG: hypothetical protein AB1486_01325 [Planctomycetota bacterium]
MHYGRTLLRVASLAPWDHPAMLRGLALSAGARELRGRLTQLTHPRSRFPGWCPIAPAALLSVLVAITPSVGAQQPSLASTASSAQDELTPDQFTLWVKNRCEELGIALPRVREGGPGLATGKVGGVVFIAKGKDLPDVHRVRPEPTAKRFPAPLPLPPATEESSAAAVDLVIEVIDGQPSMKLNGQSLETDQLAKRLRETRKPLAIYAMSPEVTVADVARAADIAWAAGIGAIKYGGVPSAAEPQPSKEFLARRTATPPRAVSDQQSALSPEAPAGRAQDRGMTLSSLPDAEKSRRKTL